MGRDVFAYDKNLLIWGGKNGNCLLAIYIHNTLTNIWVVELKSSQHPSSAEGV